MVKRWLLYLASLLGLFIFYLAYRGWIAWLLLVLTVTAPLLSLTLSLIPMLLTTAVPQYPGVTTAGSRERLDFRFESRMPLPPTRVRFAVTHSFTGKTVTLSAGEELPTDHCGKLLFKGGVYIYDYLGLFRRRLPLPEQAVIIRPVELSTDPPLELERRLAHSWQPKHGGGFAENHELRLYRPGDSLNQVHWKLSAKTGKLIIREPMVPRCGAVALTVELWGAPDELDRKMGKLLWMGKHLLELGLRYELHAATGDGSYIQAVCNEDDLLRALDGLLACRPLAQAPALHEPTGVWQCRIGGDADEN